MARRGRYRMNGNKDAKTKRQKEALERQTKTADLTPEQRLVRLDNIHGKGVGASTERKRYAARIVTNKSLKSKEVEPKKVISPILAEEPKRIAESNGIPMQVAGERVVLIFDGKTVPVVSMSQLRRIGQMNNIEITPFLKAFREHLASIGKW